jgi:signal transduction histidine kinase
MRVAKRERERGPAGRAPTQRAIRPSTPDKVAAWATRLTAPIVAPLLELKVLASFVSAAMVVMVASAIFLEMRAARSIRASLESRTETVQSLRQLREAMLDAESGQRGYLLTADARYLDPYRAALPRMDALLQSIRDKTDSDLNQRGRWVRLQRLVADKRAELAETIKLNGEHQDRAAKAIVENDWGKQTMDQARGVIAEMIAAEQNQLAVDQVRNEREQRRTDMVLLLGSFGACVLTILLNLAIRGDVAQRRTAHALIADQASKLERANGELARAQHALELALEERKSALAKVEATNQELDQFANVAAHDLKAPLRGISNLASWIEEDLGVSMSQSAREHLVLLRDRVGHMESLVNGILAYSREGRHVGELETVDLGHLLTEVLTLLAPPTERFTIALPKGLPVLQAPRVPLERIWTNLLGNAIKYGPREGATIEVSASDRGDRWEFSVADNGVGVAPKHHRRVFQLFQRVESSDAEGTGIGLAVVKKLVEGVGGRAWVESELGKGSRFSFTWPKQILIKERSVSDGRREA